MHFPFRPYFKVTALDIGNELYMRIRKRNRDKYFKSKKWHFFLARFSIFWGFLWSSICLL